ncbi:ATP-binding protein [Bradyrhizobium sp. SZCCHNS3053]|uniref:ATP-binding protein n=1 Tax=Bradyrhizobium sp. SZCCHNS3053 TaxID=3057322 RepID=UPI0029168F9C|nr:ATP-binding protein [Bradyrhizobium sp. SZCCHNS3053]
MKLGLKQREHTATGVKKEIKVAFETNAVAFYATFSGLASDKIGYPIRELCTNAWDAARGNFQVHLPTSLDPVFKVRDFGTGMSEHDMENVYARPYASKKRESNDQVGGWGIGSKSPYAYLIGDNGSGTYNVTSYHEGVMRCYVMSLADDGMPRMDLLHEGPSDEPSGIEVSFAVARSDIITFRQRAFEILWSFSPRPTVLPALDWKEPAILAQGDDWTKFDPKSVPFSGPHVRMGCVMYPVNLDKIRSGNFLDASDAVMFDAPIGSLKVTLSREDIAYDETTKTTLQSLVKKFEDNFISQLQAKVEVAPNLFEAARIFEDEVVGFGLSRSERIRRKVLWNGRAIPEHLPKENCKTNMLPYNWQSFDKFEDSNVCTKSVTDAVIVIEHNPSYSLGRFQMAELVGKKVLWIRCKRIHREQVLDALGNPEVIDLDAYKVPVEKRSSKSIRKRKTLVVGAEGHLYRMTQNVDLAEGGLMVLSSSAGWRRRRRGTTDWYRLHARQVGSMEFAKVEAFVMTAFEFGLIEQGTVILVKNEDQEVPGDWTLLAEDMIPDIRSRIDMSEFNGIRKKTINNIHHNMQSVAMIDGFAVAPEDFKQFHADLKALCELLKANAPTESTSDKALIALQTLGVEFQKPEVACPIEAITDRFEMLCERYPLLNLIVDEYHYGSDREAKKKKLDHYFGLLARPVAANDNEEIESAESELEEAA